MDYTVSPLLFRVRKVLRYARMYGIGRTIAKIQGQYHMKRTYTALPAELPGPNGRKHVGLLGCGNFGFSNVAYYLDKNYGHVLRGVMDIDVNRAASLFERYRAAYYTTDAERVVTDPAIDLVFVASNHASHAEYAIRALAHGKSVHIEKPHVVSRDQLMRLVSAMEKSTGKVTLGFNRPDSPMGRLIRERLGAEAGASMLNWFVAGHEIQPDHWYFRKEEGGRVLGNLCHWTDFVYQLVPPELRYPITIRPTRAEASDCDIAVTFTFGDGTIAAITFSAKGHTFEGVREKFAAHRGDVLVSMDDFAHLQIETVARKERWKPWFRDHGHQAAIRRAYELVRPGSGAAAAASREYVWETGELFLATKEALDQNRPITVQRFGAAELPRSE